MADNEEVPVGSYDDGGYGDGYVTPEENEKARAEMEADVKTLQQSQANELPEARQVILPVTMRKGDDFVQLGDAIYDGASNSMVVNFNTPAGRSIANFIGSGVLASVSFGAQMSRSKLIK